MLSVSVRLPVPAAARAKNAITEPKRTIAASAYGLSPRLWDIITAANIASGHSARNNGESAAPSPHITPNASAIDLAMRPDAFDHGTASKSARRAHVTAKSRGSRWVAAERTEGVSMKTAAETTPANRLAGMENFSRFSPLMRQRTKKIINRHSDAVATAPQTGASRLPDPNSFAKTAING